MKVMFRRSTENEHQYQYDEDMGPETDKKISARQKRVAKAIHGLYRREDKQSRQIREHIQRVTSLKIKLVLFKKSLLRI